MKSFIRNSVIGLGFINGLWVRLGFDPEDALLSFIAPHIQPFLSDQVYNFVFFMLPTILITIAIISAYLYAGLIGLATIALAFTAGLWITSPLGIALLAIALVIGFFISRKS